MNSTIEKKTTTGRCTNEYNMDNEYNMHEYNTDAGNTMKTGIILTLKSVYVK
jgi:hypothetical protein